MKLNQLLSHGLPITKDQMASLCKFIADSLEWVDNPTYTNIASNEPVLINNRAIVPFGIPARTIKEKIGTDVQTFAPLTNMVHLEFIERTVIGSIGDCYVTSTYDGKEYTYRLWLNKNSVVEVTSEWASISRILLLILFMNQEKDLSYFRRFFSAEHGKIKASFTASPEQFLF